MTAPIPFFSAGFRPMFLGAALWAAASMLLWVLFWTGFTEWSPAWTPLDWHVHELLFGYGGAVLAGFLLTAIPTWTGRAPVSGWPLAGLFLVWLLGRLTVIAALGLPAAVTTLLALAFPVTFTLTAAYEVTRGGNWRNLPVILLCAGFTLANLLFLLAAQEAAPVDTALGARIGLAVLILLISLIGGRIVPLFTRNWIRRHQISAPQPPEFGPVDGAVLMTSTATLFLWCALPDHAATGAAMILLGLAHLWRMSRWQGLRTLRDPLLSGLHMGYGFVPLGCVLTGLAALSDQVDPVAGLHAWTAGAIGTMTLTVMARASLGHSGRALTATPVEWFYLTAIVASGVCRILSALGLFSTPLLHLSASLWILAFLAFALRFLPVMLQPRLPSGTEA
ncbi:short-chain dehydrogenase [Epibacterium sp. SM1979]|uniref:Short-chain dehydrogenase n=1 Tax=Tritonibacter litoralis TaxID=2662264 RepID=A0A843YLA1_9RHOB|nr:NnrS family protein [Tritonibacter litoralis]MQQ10435.1 short-chain dehydrogenase [Tritonibacter litoralis]